MDQFGKIVGNLKKRNSERWSKNTLRIEWSILNHKSANTLVSSNAQGKCFYPFKIYFDTIFRISSLLWLQSSLWSAGLAAAAWRVELQFAFGSDAEGWANWWFGPGLGWQVVLNGLWIARFSRMEGRRVFRSD